MKKFKSTKLLITDHYDKMIQKLDISIEESLEKYNENDLMPNRSSDYKGNHDSESDSETEEEKSKIAGFKDPHRLKFNYDDNKLFHLDVTPGTTRVRNYLELVRSKAIEELKKAEQHNLDNYELNKDHYKYDQVTLTDGRVEEMKRNLFKDKFAFVLNIKRPNKSVFKTHTILTDFYLDLNNEDLEYLEKNIDHEDRILTEFLRYSSANVVLNEKALLLYMINEYLIEFFLLYRTDTEILTITKSTLYDKSLVRIRNMLIDHVYLPPSTTSIGLSFIKSLSLFSVSLTFHRIFPPDEIRDLSGLTNLEYLRTVSMNLSRNSLNGLNKLKKLIIYGHPFPSNDGINFDPLKGLEMLKLVDIRFPVELKCLENLKYLKIDYLTKFENLKNLSESLNVLKLEHINDNINNADEFFSRICDYLPNLYHLTIDEAKLTDLKEEWFKRIQFLKELRLRFNDLKSLEFCRFECFAKLDKLDICGNEIEKLEEGVFSKFKRLKWLNLSTNPILELGSNAFLGLENLEFLSLGGIRKFDKIEKDAFNELTNLKSLCLADNDLIYIDPEAFKHTPNLVILDIYRNNLNLEENIFAKLNHLKRITLSESDDISNDLFDELVDSNIEIKYIENRIF